MRLEMAALREENADLRRQLHNARGKQHASPQPAEGGRRRPRDEETVDHVEQPPGTPRVAPEAPMETDSPSKLLAPDPKRAHGLEPPSPNGA
jgi:hypothetical protein